MHKIMKELDEMGDLKDCLMDCLKCEVKDLKSNPAEANLSAMGAITDMIKDLSEASEKCMKKKYYEMLICDMMREDEDMHEVGRMGYDKWRYSSSGQFAPKGRGSYYGTANTRRGYMPEEDLKWPGRKLPNPMWYDADRFPMGYDGMPDPERRMENRENSKYGRSYDEYQSAKRHYTQTQNETDAHQMNEHIKEGARDTLTAMKEMWADASPEVKQSMKSGMEGLLNEMKRG